MKDRSNDWQIHKQHPSKRRVLINTLEYTVDDQTACMAHCLLLLTDAINNESRTVEKIR